MSEPFDGASGTEAGRPDGAAAGKEAAGQHQIETTDAPKAIGPYAQGVAAAGLVFTSGQLGIDPSSGDLVGGGIVPETRRTLRNLASILEAGGSGLDAALKVTVYLVDLAEFAAMNEVYGEFFAQTPPARATVGVAALPLGARVEIDIVAMVR